MSFLQASRGTRARANPTANQDLPIPTTSFLIEPSLGLLCVQGKFLHTFGKVSLRGQELVLAFQRLSKRNVFIIHNFIAFQTKKIKTIQVCRTAGKIFDFLNFVALLRKIARLKY